MRSFLFMLLVAQSSGAIWYVDFGSGSDSASGASTATSWQHCPGDSLATGVAASSMLSPSDTVIFKGGIEYKSTITVSSSGSAGNAIVFDGNSSGSFGTGKAVLNGENADSDTRRYGFYAAVSRSNIVFKNFAFEKFGGHESQTFVCGNNVTAYTVKGWGINFNSGFNITVQDCYFHDLGDFQNQTNMNGGFFEGVGFGIYGNSVSGGILITNCEFTKIGRAGVQISSLTTVTNVSIVNCNIHDYVRWGIDLVAAANNCTLSGITIDGLAMHDDYQYAPGTWLGCAGTNPHYDGIISRLANNPPVNPVTLGTASAPLTIKNCLFYVNSATAVDAGTAEVFLTTWGGRTMIYNNVFLNYLSGGQGAIYCQDGVDSRTATSPVDYHICNNSFFGPKYCVFLRTVTSPLVNFALTNGTIDIRNNIFYKSDSSSSMPVEYSQDSGYSIPAQLDYNDYYVPNRSDQLAAHVWNAGSASYETFAQLQSSGFESHGKYSDPNYADISIGLGANSSANDLHLHSSSPDINVGADLSSFFTTDKDGNTRTAGTWDIGAYEYQPISITISGHLTISGSVTIK